MRSQFDAAFAELFGIEYPRLFRYLDRVSGDPDLAADLAQEAFVRLYRRGAMPERPGVWLITVGLNLFRNDRTTRARRIRLVARAGAEGVLPHPASAPVEVQVAGDMSGRVRSALRRLPDRDQHMLLLRAEGYSYRDIAIALNLNESSIGTLLARAKRGFREAYEEGIDASG